MKLKYYIGIVIIIAVALGVFMYGFFPEHLNLTHESNGGIVSLPRGVWLSIALGLLLALGIFFFLVDWVRSKVSSYQEQRDFTRIASQILEQTGTGSYTPAIYNNQNFLLISKILRRFQLVPKLNTQNSGFNKIDHLFDILGQIELGYDQDLRKYNFDKDSPFVIKNLANKIKKDYKVGFIALNDQDISFENKKIIFLKILERCNAKEIKKALEMSVFVDKDMLFEAIEKLKSHQVFLPESEFSSFCKKAGFTEADYVELAKSLKGFFGPDVWVKFFENLTISDEKAELSFLYVLCDLELNTQVLQRLNSANKDEFLNIRAYIDLHTQGKKYPLELFVPHAKES